MKKSSMQPPSSERMGAREGGPRVEEQEVAVPLAKAEPTPSSKLPNPRATPSIRRIELVAQPSRGPTRKAKAGHAGRGQGAERLCIGHTALEPHVVLALRMARALGKDRPIDARTLLRAVLLAKGTEREPSSAAYRRLQQLLPIRDAAPELGNEALAVLTLTEPLAESLDHVLRTDADDEHDLWGRDLVTAALLTRGDPSLPRLAREAGTTVPELQDRWFAFVTASDEHRSAADWERWWRAAGVPVPAERGVRAGYLPESVDGDDGIDIKADVDAFAGLLADAETSLPLSIGLIGDWGAGKSFFMRRVRKEVRRLEGSGAGRCQRVAQIQFSAWHYSDTNIWASLVGHIFDEVWSVMAPEEDGERALAEVREQLKEAHGALFEAESEIDHAREVLVEAQRRKDEALGKLAVTKILGEEATGALQAVAAKVGWSGPLGSIVELEAAREVLRTTGQRTRAVIEVALRGPALRSAVPWILGAVALAAGLKALADQVVMQGWLQHALQNIANVGGVVGALIAAVVPPLAKARGLLQKLGTEVSETIDRYDDGVVTAARTGVGKERADEAIAAKNELVQLDARVEAAKQRMVELEGKQASLSPARRLTAFLEDRAGTQDYRSQQGIISLVRRDFEQLARLIRGWRERDGVVLPDGVRPVDRIVLYIDDLDRCSPVLVVRTLEAIHLLLALDLFVVVVAVDSRWLLRSLAVHYEDLLGARRDEEDDGYRVSTPQSYLEKIFQITFAVAPMDEAGFGRYVDHLTGYGKMVAEGKGRTDDDATKSDGAAKAEDADAVAKDEGGELSEGSAENETQSSRERSEGDTKVGQKSRERADEATTPADVTRGLSIADTERRFLKQLHGLVSTPRLLKRLINVFRLVKSRVPVSELGDFEAEASGRHRPILLLLGILYGRPELSLSLFRGLCEGTLRGEDESEALHVAVRRLEEREAPAELQGTRLADWVQAIAPDMTVAVCEGEAQQLARYSLVTGQHWHTWRRVAGPKLVEPKRA